MDNSTPPPPPPPNEHTACHTGEKEGQSTSNPSPSTYQVTHTVQYNSFKVIDNVLGELGIINDVQQTGSNDVYIIEYNNKPLCIPALVDVIKEVNINEGYMKIKLPKGLID